MLVVDDEEPLRELIVVTLGEAYSYVEAATGEEALGALAEHDTDLVVLDVMLPDMSGLEVLERMRSDERFRRVPVIVVSAWQSQEDIARALESGADDFLPKPFHPDDLESKARKLVRPR